MVEIKNVVVVGVGQMGIGIAQVSLMAGYSVTLEDIKDEFVNKAYAGIEEGMKKLEAKGALGEGKTAADFMAKVKKSTNLAQAMKDADIMVEAVIEDMKIKKDVFKTCATNAPKHCILATNTSTMSITEIGKDCGAPDRVCGMHFFNPVPLMRCIEVIKGGKTSDASMKAAEDFATKLPCLKGKRYIAIVLKDRPGFIVNRLNSPGQIYLSYCFDKAAEKKIPPEQIDGDAGTLMPMGPCELADYVGLDTMHHVMEYYASTLSPDFKPGKVLDEMVKAKKLGAKTGQGFYTWPKGGRPKIDKSKKAGLFNLEAMMAILLNEGCRILEEGVASGFKVIDEANMAGMNTPGPFGAAKNKYQAWIPLLEKLAVETKKNYFKPCELLKSGKFLEMRK